jgi:hypothetical protein
MHRNWQQFLVDQGAVYKGNQLLGFAAENAEPAAIQAENLLANLGYLGVMQVSGDDAASFLQNLLGNDVSKIETSKSQLNSFSTAKGRMLAIFRLFMHNEGYLLRLPRELLDPVSRRFQMYVLRSKVKIQALEDWVGIGVAGPQATAVLRNSFKTEAAEVNDVAHGVDLCVLRVPGPERYEIFAPSETMQTVWPDFRPSLTPSGDTSWRLLDIRNGIPTVYAATSEHFIPQMTNLQLLDGVSFKKGCYPGQEVVARMQYLGKLKRRMYRVEMQTDTAPTPGTAIVAVDNSGDRPHEAGEVVDACQKDQHTVEALAVIPIASTTQSLHLADASGPALELLPLPYPLPAEDRQG